MLLPCYTLQGPPLEYPNSWFQFVSKAPYTLCRVDDSSLVPAPGDCSDPLPPASPCDLGDGECSITVVGQGFNAFDQHSEPTLGYHFPYGLEASINRIAPGTFDGVSGNRLYVPVVCV